MAAALSTVCVLVFMLLVVLPLPPPPAEAIVPGTFFWNRRAQGGSEVKKYNKKYDMNKLRPGVKVEPIVTINIRKNNKPTRQNLREGYVVIIDGFKLTSLVLAVLKYINVLNEAYPQFHPCYSDYWTDVYRWTIRFFKTLPDVMAGKSRFIDAHKVWTKRYFFLNKFVPNWIRPILTKLCVHPLTFLKEEAVWKTYTKFAQPQWGKFYKYPKKVYDNFTSMRPYETYEQLDDSTASKD